MNPKGRVLVGVSGGVDSSVALALLLEAGYAVEGVFMKNWEEDEGTALCTSKEDFEDARAACAHLGVPIRRVNFSFEYWRSVFEPFLAAYRRGETPNPDVLCNRYVKFGALEEYRVKEGFDFLSTGHYARLDERHRLCFATDAHKDQTYFLYGVKREVFAHVKFPLGSMLKSAVRKRAEELGLANAGKKDSTGICFIGERPMREFLKRYLPLSPGVMLSDSGQVLGEHEGLWFYTIGQRSGLGVGGVKGADREAPWYVLKKDLSRNALILTQAPIPQRESERSARIRESNWLLKEGEIARVLEEDAQVFSRIRHGGALIPSRVVSVDFTTGTAEVEFDSPQASLASGQSLVLYSGEVCLGGGVIF